MSHETRRVLHPEWRDVNATTPYPFVDDALLRNNSGKFIPEGTILDASIYPIGGKARMRLSRVVVTHEDVTIYIGDATNDMLCFGQYPLLSPPSNLSLYDAYGRPAGVLVSEPDRFGIFGAWGLGVHVFTVEQTEFVADVCIPMPELGLRGFILEDGSVFTDDIWLVGDDGIVLSTEQATPEKRDGLCSPSTVEQIIRVDVVGDPLFRRRICAGIFTTPKFLRTVTAIRGDKKFVCGPDEFGDLKITVGSQDAPDTILRVRPQPDGLLIEAVGERLENIG